MPLFSFENIFFTVGTGHKQKDILKGISHTVERGQVVAIIEPSGMYPVEKNLKIISCTSNDKLLS